MSRMSFDKDTVSGERHLEAKIRQLGRKMDVQSPNVVSVGRFRNGVHWVCRQLWRPAYSEDHSCTNTMRDVCKVGSARIK